MQRQFLEGQSVSKSGDESPPLVSQERDRRIFAMTATELAGAILSTDPADSDITPLTAVTLYCRRALQCTAKINAVTEDFFVDAIREARKKTEFLQSLGKGPESAAKREALRMAKPLFGVPMSLKEQFIMKGTESTCGIAVRAGQMADEDGGAVAALRAAG